MRTPGECTTFTIVQLDLCVHNTFEEDIDKTKVSNANLQDLILDYAMQVNRKCLVVDVQWGLIIVMVKENKQVSRTILM